MTVGVVDSYVYGEFNNIKCKIRAEYDEIGDEISIYCHSPIVEQHRVSEILKCGNGGIDGEFEKAIVKNVLTFVDVDKLDAIGCVRTFVENIEQSFWYRIDEKEDEDEKIKIIANRAKEIAEKGDPVEYILNTHQRLHVGDSELAKTLLISVAVQSVLNSEGIQPKVSGDSGKGKTHACRTMAHLIPRGWVQDTSLSNKAVYYSNWKDGTVVFCDDVDMSEEFETVIKRATSNFQKGDVHTTLDIKRELKQHRIPARISWWLTSVDDNQSQQLLNRTFGGGVDDSVHQDDLVCEYQLIQATTGATFLPEDIDVMICREIIRTIKEKKYNVKIPFAKRIKWNGRSNRRNLPIFLDIVKGYAVLRHLQRRIDSDGAIIADIKDFHDAKELYTGRAENQGLKLSDIEMKFCLVLAARKEATREEIAKAISVSVGRINHIVEGKNKSNGDSGLLGKVKGLYKESRIVENEKKHKTHKTYYVLEDFSQFDAFESVVSLSGDDSDNTSGCYPLLPTVTNTVTHAISNSRSTVTTDTQNEKAHDSQYNKFAEVLEVSANNAQNSTVTSVLENRVTVVTVPQQIANDWVTVEVTPRVIVATDSGNSAKAISENDTQIPENIPEIKPCKLCMPKWGACPTSKGCNKARVVLEEKYKKGVEAVRRFCVEWSAAKQMCINGTNAEQVAVDFIETRGMPKSEYESVLKIVRLHAGIVQTSRDMAHAIADEMKS